MIWRAIIGGLWKPLAWLFGAVALWAAGRRSGAVRASDRAVKGSAKARDAGRKATAKAKADLASGKKPDEIVRSNDGAWE